MEYGRGGSYVSVSRAKAFTGTGFVDEPAALYRYRGPRGQDPISGDTRPHRSDRRAINSVRPDGHADFRTKGTERQLSVEVEHVLPRDGTLLSANVNGAAVGTIVLASERGELELNTNDSAVVPAIKAGDVVAVTMDGVTVPSGVF